MTATLSNLCPLASAGRIERRAWTSEYLRNILQEVHLVTFRLGSIFDADPAGTARISAGFSAAHSHLSVLGDLRDDGLYIRLWLSYIMRYQLRIKPVKPQIDTILFKMRWHKSVWPINNVRAAPGLPSFRIDSMAGHMLLEPFYFEPNPPSAVL